MNFARRLFLKYELYRWGGAGLPEYRAWSITAVRFNRLGRPRSVVSFGPTPEEAIANVNTRLPELNWRRSERAAAKADDAHFAALQARYSATP